MQQKPILFSTPMVQAILKGAKTVTRRTSGFSDALVENAAEYNFCGLGVPNYEEALLACFRENPRLMTIAKFPYGILGTILWVREAWSAVDGKFIYRADDFDNADISWRPSIHMPKSACRIWLEITDIRVERLQDISKDDAIHEGIEELAPWPEAPDRRRFKSYMPFGADKEEAAFFDPIASFYTLWASINGDDSVVKNPWVWVIDFKRIEKQQADEKFVE